MNKKSAPYWLGILGLIPLVGAFVGIGLILYGIFKYKDRLLIFIGGACILVTVIVYATLFDKLRNGGFFYSSFQKTTQTQLNNLVKSIEHYHSKTGSYPTSLEALKIEDNTVITVDAFARSKEGHEELQYFRSDTTFSVFSVGKDRLPNTPDDIYPSIDK